MAMLAKDAGEDVVQGHCPSCGPDRKADVKGHYQTRFSEAEGLIWGQTDFRLLVCRGCETAYFQTEEVFSEDAIDVEDGSGGFESYIPARFVHYPSPIKREKPKWWAELVFIGNEFGKFESLFSDIYGCLNANLSVPAAIATRTAFDHASEILGIEPSLSFEKKLDALEKIGKIGLDERDVLEVLVNAGSAAAHRGWRPNPEQIETLVTIIENFVYRTFILGEAARNLRA